MYENILENLDPFYLEHAVQYFSIMWARQEPPSALLFSMADKEEVEFSLHIQPAVWTDSRILKSRIDVMKRRLNSRCKGLIEIREYRTHGSWHWQSLLQIPTVQYLHKTVKDYIEKPAVQNSLSKGLTTPLDPHIQLCSAFLGVSRVMSMQDELSDMLSMTVAQCMRHAARVSSTYFPTMLLLLDKLRDQLEAPKLKKWFSSEKHFRKTARYERRCQSAEEGGGDDDPTSKLGVFGNTFLSLAIKYEVVEYVTARLASHLAQFDEETTVPLLHSATSTIKTITWWLPSFWPRGQLISEML